MSFKEIDVLWSFIKSITLDINQSANNKISDFKNIIAILTSEYALTNERYSALFEIMARFRTSDIGTMIQTDFDRHGGDLKFLERNIILIEEFESEFSFLFEPRVKKISATQTIECEYDYDLVRAMLGTRGSSVESLQKEKAIIMSDWLRTVRKILDDAEMKLFPTQTTITEVADKASSASPQQEFLTFLKEQQKKKEEKSTA